MTSAQDFKTEIDQWLGSKDERTIRKIWQVVSAINCEWQLRDEDIFDIPYGKFERARITNSKDLEIVLEALHKRTVIEVSKKTRSFLLDPNEPHSFWDEEVAKIEMFKTADTQVKIFPKKFGYLQKQLREIVHTGKTPNGTKETASQFSKQSCPCPYCVIGGVWGYFKFGKYCKRVKIGKLSSRHFRLLQCLTESFGVSKTIDSIFDRIRLPKDKNDSRLLDWNTSGNRRIEIIKYSIKELQKGNKLEHKIKFEFNDQKTQIKASLTD